MNNTGGNAIRLQLTNFQPALKKLQIKSEGKVRSSWGLNQPSFEMNIFLQMQLHSICWFVLMC